MADEIEIFHILKDKAGNNTGVAPTQANIGDAPAGLDGILALGFRDTSGNLVLPQLNPEGALPVTLDPGTPLREHGVVASGSQTVNVRSALATIVLTAEKLYTKMAMQGACRRACLFELVYIEDVGGTPVETVLLSALISSGQFTTPLVALLTDFFSTVGATGTLNLVMYGTPLDKASDIRGQVSVNEVA